MLTFIKTFYFAIFNNDKICKLKYYVQAETFNWYTTHFVHSTGHPTGYIIHILWCKIGSELLCY